MGAQGPHCLCQAVWRLPAQTDLDGLIVADLGVLPLVKVPVAHGVDFSLRHAGSHETVTRHEHAVIVSRGVV